MGQLGFDDTNLAYIRHDAAVEPSQGWDNEEEDGENDTNDHNDPRASRHCAEHALNRLYPNSKRLNVVSNEFEDSPSEGPDQYYRRPSRKCSRS